VRELQNKSKSDRLGEKGGAPTQTEKGKKKEEDPMTRPREKKRGAAVADTGDSKKD